MVTNPTNKKWLDLTVEETLEPDLKICDPHHHLWDFRTAHVAHKYLIDEILLDMNAGHNVVSTVFVEGGSMYRATGPNEMKPVGETEYANGIAAMCASGLYGNAQVCAGIVGAADLTLGDAVKPVLEAHLKAGGGRFRGIRHQLNWDASDLIPTGRTNPGMYTSQDANFREGFASLSQYGLSFDAWCYHPQLPQMIELAQAFPDTVIILNHIGGPLGAGPYAGKRKEIFPVWKQAISDLAACPNVVVKLGGLNLDLNGFGWHLNERPPSSEILMQTTRRYYEHAIEQFGVKRCMFESDFPPDMVACSYNVLWNSFKRLTADYSSSEKADLYHDTASRIYKLD